MQIRQLIKYDISQREYQFKQTMNYISNILAAGFNKQFMLMEISMLSSHITCNG